MSQSVNVETVDPDPVNSTVVHRFRNFGEEVFRELGDTCDIDLGEIDRATTRFSVRGVRSRDVSEVTRILQRLLAEHSFEDSTTLTWADSE